MDSQKKGFVLSLQDLCKLKILLNVELFPLKSLAQLPQSMRYRIFRILPPFDRLHYDSSPHEFLSEIFQLQDISRPETTENEWYAQEILYGNTDNMKQILVRSLFNASNETETLLGKGCCIDLKEASQFLDCLSSDEDPILKQYVFEYIERCYSCIVISWPNVSQDNANIGRQAGTSAQTDPFNNYIVIPSRFEEFLTIKKHTSHLSRFSIIVHKPQALISYCNLQGIPYPSSRLVVDTKQFLRSPLWNLFTPIKEKAIQSSTIKHSASPDPVPTSDKPMVDHHHFPGIIINPTCPFVQDILSSVEHLEITSYWDLSSWRLFEEAADFSIDAPSFIMHIIMSQETHPLKSIRIDEYIPVADSFINLDTVTAFLCGNADGPVVRSLCDDDDKGNEYSFMPPNNKPCFIEKLSINAVSEKRNNANCELLHMLEHHTASISRNVRRIIKCHESTLDSISLHGDVGFAHENLVYHDILGFSHYSRRTKLEVINPEEYCSLVQTTFIDFIRFPQFKSLELDDSPDQVCHPLVMAYLSTPATHEQYLTISLKPDARPVPKPDSYRWCDILLPESNLKYKSLRLNLKGKESQVIKHLLRFPNLSLKSLNLSTHYLSADSSLPSTVNIQCFTLNLHDNKFSCSKLDLFICKNPSLTTFIMQDYFRHKGIDILTLKKVNDCLIRLVKKQATLESIILDDVKLWTDDSWTTVYSSQQPSSSIDQPSNANCFSDSVDGCSEEYDITQWFSPYFVTKVANHDIKNIDVIIFFYLVQKLNATLLFAKESMRIFQEDLPSHFIPSLVHAEIMIRKVVLNGYFKKWKDEFSKIARIVETD